MKLTAAVLVTLVLAGMPLVAPWSRGAARPPQGLSASDWSSIRKQYDRHRQAAFPVDGGHRARNYGQQWTTRFDGRGFEVIPDAGAWRWGLELQSYGFAGQERRVAQQARVVANVERLSYHWNAALEEWFINDGRGLEHGFTLARRPEGTGGRLRMRLGVRGGLMPRVSSDGRTANFVDAGGRAVLQYAGLKVTDAGGRELAARLQPDDAGLRIDVEESGATYPLTIGPIVQQAYLKPASVGTSQAFDSFGWAVAVSGDTVVVGAPVEDSNSTGVNSAPNDGLVLDAGAVYVFVRTGGTWTQQAYLKPASVGTTQSGDQFGLSVAVSGDTIVVGAPTEDSATTGVNSTPIEGSVNSGAAYVFTRSGVTWTQQAYLKPASVGTTQAGDLFGWTVAVSGDTVVVGARGEDSSTTGINSAPNESALDSGAAYVFVRSGITWTQQAYLKPASVGATQAGDNFGFSVAVSGNTAVVGARLEDSSTTGINSTPIEGSINSGAAYVFTRSGVTWTQQAYLKPASVGTTQASDLFGTSVAVSGDTVVVGALGEDSSTTGVNSAPNETDAESGAAYVFTRSGVTWTQQAYLKPASVGLTQAGDFFGSSVAVLGDTVVVGAYFEDSSTTGINSIPNELAGDSGAAYVFTRSGVTWTQQAYLKPASVGTTQVSDRFGFAVGVSGDTVVVGAIWEDSSTTVVNSTPDESASDAGAAYVFTLASNTAPTITPAAVSRQAGTSGTVQIAAVNDAEDLETALAVTVQSANPSNDVTLSLISVDGSGNVTADVAASAGATNASFTLRVTDSGGMFAEGTLNVTVTQPISITPNITPPANGNGWHMGPVTVSWIVTNADTQTGCGTMMLSAETAAAGTTFTCSASNSGGTTILSVTVWIDLTAPLAGGSRTPLANANGWNNTDVTANFTCADSLSGVVAAASSSTVMTEGAGQSRSFLCQDQAGNTATAMVSGINVDKTAPTGTASRTPPNGNGWNNTDVTASFTCDDTGGSGVVAAASLQTISIEGPGQSSSFLCQDLAGNSLGLLVSGVNIDKTQPAVTPASVAATPNPAMVNAAIALAANLTDAGTSGLAMAEYRIDAGAYMSFGSPSGAAASVSGSIGSFAAPAVVNACVRATDLAGNQSLQECTMIALYDPGAGFVTGAGIFESPPGALTGSPATGKAHFAFQSRYSPGAPVPTGNTHFKFKTGNFEFNSTGYDWLVVAGARAQFKGGGVIANQAGAFNFMVTAIDGALPGGGGQDKFRIKIMGPGGVVYDNQMGADDSGDPSTAIDGGNIVIHK